MKFISVQEIVQVLARTTGCSVTHLVLLIPKLQACCYMVTFLGKLNWSIEIRECDEKMRIVGCLEARIGENSSFVLEEQPVSLRSLIKDSGADNPKRIALRFIFPKSFLDLLRLHEDTQSYPGHVHSICHYNLVWV